MKHLGLLSILIPSFLITTVLAQPAFFYHNEQIRDWYLDAKQKDVLQEANKVASFSEVQMLINEKQVKVDSLYTSFHFIDFDNDGLRDLLFDGKIGSKKHVLIFRKKNDSSYTLVLNQAGEILQANAPFQNNPLSLTLWNPNCCGYKVSELTKWVAIIHYHTSYFQIQDKSLIYRNTLLPDVGVNKVPQEHFTIQTDVAKLRLSPRLDDESVIEGLNAWKGNHVSYHPKGTPGVIYHSIKDNNDVTWYFVRIFTGQDYPTKSDRFKVSEEIANCEEYSYFGWIHGDNLKIIKP